MYIYIYVDMHVFIYIYIYKSHANSLKKEKSSELKGLEFSYIQLMTDMEQKVQRLVDMQVDWSRF